jgi:hypothetical protein
MSEVLEKLKKEVALLNNLLQHPQPGLMSWNMVVAERWHSIIELYDPRLEELAQKIKNEELNELIR